jgi:hypothetical protein
MLSSKTLTASLLAAAALVPATANAAGAHLGGQPTMRAVDAHHATLQVTANRTPHVRFAGGQRVAALKATGRHGRDTVYTATVSSRSALRVGAKYTVSIRLSGAQPVKRLVTLHAAR